MTAVIVKGGRDNPEINPRSPKDMVIKYSRALAYIENTALICRYMSFYTCYYCNRCYISLPKSTGSQPL